MATERIHQQGSLASLRKIPVRKTSTRYTTKPPARMPEFEMLKSSDQTATVVIAVTESLPSSEEISQGQNLATKPSSTTARVRPQPPPLVIPKKAHLPRNQPVLVQPASVPKPSPSSAPVSAPAAAAPPPPPPVVDTATADRAPSTAHALSTQQNSSFSKPAPAPPKKDCADRAEEDTPVMRSMFPTYDHSIPLGRQDYRPTVANVPEALQAGSDSEPSNNPYRSKRASAVPSVNPSNVKFIDSRESPLRRSESLKRAPSISASERLANLWNIANGQGYEEAEDLYTLELNCDDLSHGHEIINFSTSDSVNMYTLAASSAPTSPVQTSRANPAQSSTRIPICTSTLGNPTRQDPLVCSIYPKLAGLMALDQSSSEAISKNLNRTACELLQKDALDRSQEREASMLLWDADSDRFCILHPSLLDNAATSIPIEISPNASGPARIEIFAPETRTALLTLDMKTLVLSIHAQAITALPSLYILDTLVTSLLTLLLHLHRRCSKPRKQMASPQLETREREPVAPYFPPPPSSVNSRNSGPGLKAPRPAFFRSNRSAASPSVGSTLASPTSLYPPSGRSFGKNDKDIELGELSPDGTSLSTSIVKQKPPKGMFSTDDENLPAGTRAVLKFLYCVFEALYWILGLLVQVLAAAVVAGGKLVTKL